MVSISVSNIRQTDLYIVLPQCSELQQAIDSAKSGTVIRLKNITCHYTKALQITAKRNLTIEGEGKVWIIVDDLIDDVIKIEDSEQIFLKNIKARHKMPLNESGCTGSVVAIKNSKEIGLARCELNGSGDVGVFIENSNNVIVSQCYLHHNNSAAFWLDGSSHVAIHNNTITENGSTIYGANFGVIVMDGNIISNNKGGFTASSVIAPEMMADDKN